MRGMHTRPFRDRHARGLRGPLVSQQVPRYHSPATRFDRAVVAAYAPLARRFGEHLAALDVAVDTIPRMRLHPDMTIFPDDIVADGPVPLGRIVSAGIDAAGRPTRARLIVFRMPIEARVSSGWERAELLRVVVTSLVANYLNLSPQDIDPGAQWE